MTIHRLRYIAATRLAALGLDWQSIADIIGHLGIPFLKLGRAVVVAGVLLVK